MPFIQQHDFSRFCLTFVKFSPNILHLIILCMDVSKQERLELNYVSLLIVMAGVRWRA